MIAVAALVTLRAVVALDGFAPLGVDIGWNDLMVETRTDPALVVAEVLAVVGGTVGMIVVGLLLISLLAWRRGRRAAVTLAVAMIAVVAVGATMAVVVSRTRPVDSLAETAATSFPSGHTAVATCVALILALVLHRRAVWVLGALWVAAMMWSRTYLHAHWLSDVVAGMLEGVAVALLVWIAVDVSRRRQADRRLDRPVDGPLSPSLSAHDTPTEGSRNP